MIDLIQGDALATLATLPAGSARCCVTSPPYYGLRDYGVAGQLGREDTPEDYVARLVAILREVRRVLADDGTLWLNLGDSYAMTTKGAGGAGKQHTNQGSIMADRSWAVPQGMKPKDLLGIPWLVAFALRADGWYLRSDIIWQKPNAMPESVRDRPTKAHEYVFLLTKRAEYYYNANAIREPNSASTVAAFGNAHPRRSPGTAPDRRDTDPQHKGVKLCGVNPLGRNKRSVWSIPTRPFNGARLMADYVGRDGKPYKASPDCPLHGHLARERKTYTGGHDAPPDRAAPHNPGTDGRPAVAPDAAPASTTARSCAGAAEGSAAPRMPGSTPDHRTSGCRPGHTSGAESAAHTGDTSASHAPTGHSPDSPGLAYAPPATPRSTESRRTAHGPATNPACTPSAQTPARTGDTSASPACGGPQPSSPASSSAAADSAYSASAQTAGGNARRSASDSSAVPPLCNCTIVSLDHFAVMPEALAEVCVRAGSARGDVVLDPFCGAGTTGVVAARHGRGFVGIDLNADYLALARERLAAAGVASLDNT